MKVKTSYKTLEQAVNYVNKIFNNNISMETEDRGLYYLVKLKVKDSKEKGGRRSPNGRRLSSACWHVYGYFIDTIFELDKDAVVYTAGKIFNRDTWHWIDWNVGSLLNPIFISELCDCEKT
jgi:hypothetical protein